MRGRAIWFVCILCIGLWIAGIIFPEMTEYMSLSSSFRLFLHNPWSIVTYMFAHTGANHLYFNMLCLLLLGSQLEIYGGKRLLLLSLFIGGIIGGLAYLASCSIIGWHGNLCGISAGVLGLTAALSVIRPYPGIVLAAVLLLGLSLIGNTPPEMAAHVSGGAAGAIVGVIVRIRRNTPPIEIALDKAVRSGFSSLTPAERGELLPDNKGFRCKSK